MLLLQNFFFICHTLSLSRASAYFKSQSRLVTPSEELARPFLQDGSRAVLMQPALRSQKDKEDLEEVSTELELADEDELVR